MHIPEDFAMRPGWIYEVVATTLGERGFHAAPIGVWTRDGETLMAELYKGSTTLANIARNGILGVNLVSDPVLLHNALHRRDTLVFVTDNEMPGAETPFLRGADAWLELAPSLISGETASVHLHAKLTHWRQFAPVRLLNRAAGLLLESLVLSTRRHILPAEHIRDQLFENARVIMKVAPDSSYATAIAELLTVCALSS